MWKKYKFLNYIMGRFSGNQAYPPKLLTISGQDYQFQEIHLKDIKDLLSIEREVYEGTLPWTKPAFVMELKAPDPHLYLLVKSKEQTVGFIGCRLFKNKAHVTNIAVATKFQGKGLGTHLIKEVQRFALINQCKKLSLEVRLSNKNAQHVYRKLGFISCAIKQNYYSEDKEDALEMTLDLKEDEANNLL